MNLAQHASETSASGRLEELLSGYFPEPGQEDLRGFEWYYLWNLCHGPSFAQDTVTVWSLAYSPDGTILASGTWDGTVKLREAATGKERMTLRGHTSLVNSVVFSPNGRMVATGSG